MALVGADVGVVALVADVAVVLGEVEVVVDVVGRGEGAMVAEAGIAMGAVGANGAGAGRRHRDAKVVQTLSKT